MQTDTEVNTRDVFFFCEANFTDNIAEESTGLNLEGRGVVKGGGG